MLSLLYNVLSLYEYFIRLHKLFQYKCCLDFKIHAVKRLKSDAREKKISLGISLPGSCAISWVTKRTKVAHLYMNRDRDSYHMHMFRSTIIVKLSVKSIETKYSFKRNNEHKIKWTEIM